MGIIAYTKDENIAAAGEIRYYRGDAHRHLFYIEQNATEWTSLYFDGAEFTHLMAHTKNLPNLSGMKESYQTFVGDLAANVAANLTAIFPEGWDKHL